MSVCDKHLFYWNCPLPAFPLSRMFWSCQSGLGLWLITAAAARAPDYDVPHNIAPDRWCGHRLSNQGTSYDQCPVVWYFNYHDCWFLTSSIVPCPVCRRWRPDYKGVGSSIKIGGKASGLWRSMRATWRGSVWTWRMPSLPVTRPEVTTRVRWHDVMTR